MPLEAFCALPEKSPPIVCEEKRPSKVRYGTSKSGYLILVLRTYWEVIVYMITDVSEVITTVQLKLVFYFPISSERRFGLCKVSAKCL